MKMILTLTLSHILSLVLATAALGQTQIAPDTDASGGSSGGTFSSSSSLGGKLTNHGGPTVPNARVVYLFWGTLGSDYTSELQAYRDHSAGMKAHMSMLGQYNASQTTLTSTTQPDVYDASEPPVAVTDTDLRAALMRNFAGRYDNAAIYTIVLPDGHYTTRGGYTSCGGPAVQYCGFHDSFFDSATGIHVKYAVVPYVSCQDCRVFAADGGSANEVQSAEVVVVHEVREAMTDPLYSAWWTGQYAGQIEADDKCAWHVNGVEMRSNIFYTAVPAGPMDTQYWHPGYFFFFQKEWSNSANACVQ